MVNAFKKIREFGSQRFITATNLMSRYSIQTWTMPIALAVIIVVSYGIMIRKLGFYWDEWPFIQNLTWLGPDGFEQVLGINRQITALVYGATTRILKDIPIRWQLFGLFTRWLSAVSLGWALHELWRVISPSKASRVPWMALLFAVYPSFTQQSITIVYSHFFLYFSVFNISLAAMFRAMRTKSNFYWGISWITAGLCLFSENFLGLQLIRPYLLWLLLDETRFSGIKRVKRALVYWIPYLVLIVPYAVWRFFLLPPTKYELGTATSFLSDPVGMIFPLSRVIISDIFEVSILVWERTIQLSKVFTGGVESLFNYKVVILSVWLFTLIYLSLKRRSSFPVVESGEAAVVSYHLGESDSIGYHDQDSELQKTASQGKLGWTKHPLWLGFLFMFFSGIPFWVVPLEISLDFSLNRYTIPMMLGASIFIVGLVDMLTRSDRNARIIIALLVGFAAGYHYQSAYSFSIEWSLQKDFIWQFLWRVPYLEPGTMILGDGFPFAYSDDEAATSMINLAYRQEVRTTELPYAFFFVSDALGNEIQSLDPGTEVGKRYGLLDFSGSISKMVAVSYSGNDCLQILFPPDDDLGQVYPEMLSEVVYLSDPSLIEEIEDTYDSAGLERHFGKEPAHTWCYYYQKAELARQSKQWNRVAKLGDQAGKRGYEPYVPEELFPFIEGYANVGEWEKAQQLTLDAFEQTRTLRPDLCAIWKRIPSAATAAGAGSSIHRDVLEELECDWLE